MNALMELLNSLVKLLPVWLGYKVGQDSEKLKVEEGNVNAIRKANQSRLSARNPKRRADLLQRYKRD